MSVRRIILDSLMDVVALASLGLWAWGLTGCSHEESEPVCDNAAIDEYGVCGCSKGGSAVRPVSECSPATMGTEDLVCCDNDHDCYCMIVGCDSLGPSSCLCDFNRLGSTGCAAADCCNFVDANAPQCRCGLGACPSGSVSVPSCSIGTLACTPNGTRVSSCHPKP